MYIELQWSASVFTRIVRNRLRSLPLGVDLSFPDPDGTPLVVDQVIIGDTTTLQREQTLDYSSGLPQAKDAATQSVWTLSPTNLFSFTVPYLQVKQEVKVLLVRASDLKANGPAPTAPYSTMTLFLVFNIALTAANQTQGGGPLTLSYALAYIDFGVLSGSMTDAQRAQITQVIAGVQIAPSSVDFGALTKLLQRPGPVSAINAGIACDPAGTRVALRADFDVYASPIAVERNFFEAGPADLLAGKDWAMLMDANVLIQQAEHRIKDSLQAKANLRILSDPKGRWDPGETTLRIGANVRLLGVCPGFVDDIDMDVALDLGAHFSVPTPDHLITHYQLDSAKTNNDQVFGCALTGALLYPIAGLALFDKGKIGLLDYLGGIAFGPYLAFGQLVGVIAAQKLEDDISKSLGDTCHKINDEEYECTTAVNLVIQLVPTRNSRLVLELARGVPEGLVLSGTVANLGELFMGGIGDISVNPFKWQILGGCTGNGKGNFRIGNVAKISVPYTPPAKLTKVRILSDPQNGYTLTVNDNDITVTPRTPPVSYPCEIRLITNRGVRTLTLPPAQPISDTEKQGLDTALLGALLSCFYWEKHFTKIETIRWLIDPPFHVVRDRAVQQWQILVIGADPSNTLKVLTPDGATVLTGHPASSGSLHISLMFPADSGPQELTLELERPPNDTAQPLELSVQQTLYSLRATLPVQGTVQRMEVNGTLRQPQLSITTARQNLRWDVRTPLAPQLLESTTRATLECPEEPVFHSGRQLGTAPTLNLLRALAGLSGRQGRPQVIGSPQVLGFPETLYLRTECGAAVYDISVPDQPKEIQTLSAPGWYEDTATGLNLMARYDPERQVVNLYDVAGQHTL